MQSLARLESLIADAKDKSRGLDEPRRKYDRERGRRFVEDRRDGENDQRRNRSRSDDRSRYNNRRSRSRSKDRYRDRRDQEDQRSRGKESGSNRYSLAFKKPDQDADYSSAASTSKSTSYSGSKNWKKPDARNRDVDKKSEASRPGIGKSDSESEDKSDVEESEKNEEDVVMTEAEMNQLGARIVKCEIMGDDVS